MYSWSNFYNIGIQKTIFSIPTLLFGLSGIIEQKANIFGTIIFFLYLGVGSYVKFFNFLKLHEQPTSSFYKTNIPTFAFQMLTYYIVFSFSISIYMKFIN